MMHQLIRNQLTVERFNVADCKMHWQKNGDFLCVKVDRYKKKLDDKDAQVKYGVSAKRNNSYVL